LAPDRGDDAPSFVAPRPYGFFALLRGAARIYARNVLAFALLFVPLYLFATLLVAPLAGPDPEPGAQLLTGAILGVAFPAATSAATAVAVAVIFERLAGRPATVPAAARALRGRWKDLLSAAFLAAILIVIVNLFLQILFSVQFVALLVFLLLNSVQPVLSGPPIVVHLIITKGTPMREALGRARELLRGNLGRTLGNAVMLALLLGVLALVVNGLLFGVVRADAARAIANTVMAALFAPYVVSFLTLVFLDLEEQHDDAGRRRQPG
jgi:hypothetical protein